MIPFLDLKQQYQDIREALHAELADTTAVDAGARQALIALLGDITRLLDKTAPASTRPGRSSGQDSSRSTSSQASSLTRSHDASSPSRSTASATAHPGGWLAKLPLMTTS